MGAIPAVVGEANQHWFILLRLRAAVESQSVEEINFDASGGGELLDQKPVAFGDTAFGADQADRRLQPVVAAHEQVAGALDESDIALAPVVVLEEDVASLRQRLVTNAGGGEQSLDAFVGVFARTYTPILAGQDAGGRQRQCELWRRLVAGGDPRAFVRCNQW